VIPLRLPSQSDAEAPYVAKLSANPRGPSEKVRLLGEEPGAVSYATPHGLLTIEGAPASELERDVVLVHPGMARTERLLRSNSRHNTLLVTERCDQLCVMCSQPPKKTHHDRFALLEEACLLAEPDQTIGITGGEPTLYKEQLFGLVERVIAQRSDLSFHILSNGQHFSPADLERLRQPQFTQVVWGIPLYASEPSLHDTIVGKAGAFDTLQDNLATLAFAGARIELRTVLLTTNQPALPSLARYIGARLRFLEAWSIMQLENIGFARNRWASLYVDHAKDFSELEEAIDLAELYQVPVRLFNFPKCSVPDHYRHLALASISDWKRKYAPACDGCRQRDACCGFFEWHPEALLAGVRPL
jgi:His-Xaa-Ser system radical SAM maturase HxsC